MVLINMLLLLLACQFFKVNDSVFQSKKAPNPESLTELAEIRVNDAQA